MQQINLPVKIVNQFCEEIGVQTAKPPYLVKSSVLSIDFGVRCDPLEPRYWKIQISLSVTSKEAPQDQEEPDTNYTLDGIWTAIAFNAIPDEAGVSEEEVRKYLINTVGGLLFGNVRAQVSTTLMNFGYSNVVLPPLDSAVLVNKLAEADAQDEIVFKTLEQAAQPSQ